jgi:proteasome accessory factor C
MAKQEKFGAVDRFNLMLALVAYLTHADGPVEVRELAERFNAPEADVISALSTVTNSGVKPYGPGDLFDIDMQAVREDGIAVLTFAPTLEDVPKLSARQSAALIASLLILKEVDGFSEGAEIDELIELLNKGSISGSTSPIVIAPGTVDSDVLVLRRAIANSNQISCDYRNAQGEQKVRTIEPLRIESLDHNWYLRGYCPERKKVLAFKLDRMRSIEILDQTVSKEAQAAEISEDIYTANATDTQVTLQVMPEAVSLITDFRPVREPVSQKDGSTIFDVSIADLRILGKLIARFGGAARVLEPASAREIVRDYSLRALGSSTIGNQLESEE